MYRSYVEFEYGARSSRCAEASGICAGLGDSSSSELLAYIERLARSLAQGATQCAGDLEDIFGGAVCYFRVDHPTLEGHAGVILDLPGDGNDYISCRRYSDRYRYRCDEQHKRRQ